MPYQLLLIDDNPCDIALLSDALSECSVPVAIRSVDNAVLAFRYLSKQGEFHDAPTPDLIVLDLSMPIIDGMEVLYEVRSKRSLSGVPVVVLTSSTRADDRAACLALGAREFLCKPAVWDEHRALADRLLRFIPGIAVAG